ncbi:hypothetical protein [Streptomyces sp. NPDC005407]|uniref:hypothetical protein n=1 Tax=Streptomyces sp. NPDC005407 TaxID=3155340 RepID=UPI0033B4578A
MLLIVIRDIVTTVARTSIIGLILKVGQGDCTPRHSRTAASRTAHRSDYHDDGTMHRSTAAWPTRPVSTCRSMPNTVNIPYYRYRTIALAG